MIKLINQDFLDSIKKIINYDRLVIKKDEIIFREKGSNKSIKIQLINYK